MIFIQKYKCRNCGEIFEIARKINEEIDFNDKENIQILPQYNQINFIVSAYSRKACALIVTHRCEKSDECGIADLISVDGADDDLYTGVINS